MRKFISSVLALTLSLGIFGGAIGVSAAEGAVTQFEIIVPATARVNEAIDVTVRAVDKDKKVVTGYRGSIIFVPESFGDTVPMPGKSIAFSAEDNGEKKFSKGVIFKSAGNQKVSVVDVIDDISGDATVNVEASTTTTTTNLEEVTIISPAKDSKVTTDVVAVSGKARKNSKLNILLNGKDMGSTLSDESGVYTKSLTGITQAVNLLSVNLVDGDGKVIGKSEEISFEKVSGGPAFYNLTVKQGLEVEASSPITFNVEADAGMSEVTLLMDGTSLTAKEQAAGNYSVETVAPMKTGTYPISVTVGNALGQKTTKSDVLSLTVTEKASSFANVKATAEGTKAIFEFGVNNAPTDLDKFRITYTEEGIGGNTGEVVTWNKDKILSGTGTYKWYIDKLSPKTYSFKILGLRADGTTIDTLASDNISVTVGNLTSCTIGNVGEITVQTLADKSILSWKSVTGALSYNLYKIDDSGKNVLFQNTKDTTYTIFLSSGAIVNENFGIKALCDDKTESADLSKVSKVQTGPGLTSIIIIISGILGALIMRRRMM